jgi:hypothetical protein
LKKYLNILIVVLLLVVTNLFTLNWTTERVYNETLDYISPQILTYEKTQIIYYNGIIDGFNAGMEIGT